MQQGKAHDALPELIRSNELKPDMPETLYLWAKHIRWSGTPPEPKMPGIE